MKKVYFACSIRGGRADAKIYAQIVEILKQKCELLTEIFADNKLTPMGSPDPSEKIWKRDLEWVESADVLIAEVTNPSLGVGYEIAKAEEWNKPILCLYRPSQGKSLSAMIAGSPKTKIVEYQKVSELKKPIKQFLNS